MRPHLHGMSHVPAPVVHHHVECIHQAEIEVWPATAEAYFLDEQYADAAAAQIRFDATVVNTPSRAIRWEVQSLSGGPGRGTIDGSGLYTAPNKGDLASGTTEIVVATAVDDPLRKAFARVTLVGRGPEAAPSPRLEIFPRHCNLYTHDDLYNLYIDVSNKRQMFRVEVTRAEVPESDLVWTIRTPGFPPHVTTGVSRYLYDAPAYLSEPPLVTITVSLLSRPEIATTATVQLLTYAWPKPPYWLPPVPPPEK